MSRNCVSSILFLALPALAGLSTSPYARFINEPRVALIIGVDHSANKSIPPLAYAGADAKTLAGILSQQAYDVNLMLDPTKEAVLTRLRAATAAMHGKGTFMIYFSGNGVMDADGRQYLQMFDTDYARLRETGLDLSVVVDILRDSSVSQKLVMVDACSEQIHGAPAAAATPTGNVLAEAVAKVQGLAILNATGRGGIAFEDQKVGHGVFSNFVIEGLKGKAAGTDGLVTFLSLADYVSYSVRQYSRQIGQSQSPYSAGDPQTDFIVAGKPIEPSVPALVTETRGTIVARPPAASAPAAPGKSYALVMGINDYASLKKLTTAVADATDISAELKKDYGFEVETLLNPGRAAILKALNQYRNKLSKTDSLLIYFAGHGYHDEKTSAAYWFPADAEDNDTTNWIAADDITRNLKGMDARHVLIVSDSCYSGMLDRDPDVHMTAGDSRDHAQYLAKVAGKTSRYLFASGGNEPVNDGGGDGRHSVFATVFLSSLKEMDDKQFADEELCRVVRIRVGGRSAQTPECSALHNSGHDGGALVFTRTPQ